MGISINLLICIHYSDIMGKPFYLIKLIKS